MASTSATCVQHHSAFIYDRGGRRRIDEAVDLSQVQWSRIRDNTSDAMIRIEGESCSANADLIRKVRSKRHDLVIFRGDERVWEGPINRVASHSTFAEIHAKDISAFLFAQPMTQRYSNATVDGVSNSDTVTGRIEKIIQYEMSHGRTMFFGETVADAAADVAEWIALGGVATPVEGGWNVFVPAFEDDSMWPPVGMLEHMDVRHFPNEARTAMTTEAYQMTVGTHLQTLARQSGIDFTVIGRRLLIWDVSRSLGVLQTMTKENFLDDVVVTEYGSDHTQAAYSIGQNGAYGAALSLKNLAYYGPWTTMYTPYNEEGTEAASQSELNSQARRNLAGRTPVPIEVRIPDNSSIILSEVFSINTLIPGVQVPLRATLNARDISQQQKIDIVRVTETGDGENVQVTLTPATKPDEDEVIEP